MTPPYQPKVSGPEDTSNFDTDDLKPANKLDAQANLFSTKDSLLNVHLPFVGFTCTFTGSHNSTFCSKDEIDFNGDNTTVSPTHSLENSSATEVAVSKSNCQKLEKELQVARQEWSELSSKMADLRKEKTIISSRLRSKEEDLEQQMEKIADLRQQLRNSEKIKRQQLDDLIVIQDNLDQEKKLRKDCNNIDQTFLDSSF